jgi:hypothetical protein
MADWVTISSLATAGGTLVLAMATFASVRSANRAARVAERSLLLGLRPVLVPSRPEDPPERVTFLDRTFTVNGGVAHVEEHDERVYMAIPLRNVGAGLAVLHGWQVYPERPSAGDSHGDPETFRMVQRDLYVASGDTGYWQGALRDTSEELHGHVREAIEAGGTMAVEVLYGDHEGGQRTISRYGLTPDGDGPEWRCSVLRHWQLEGLDPRH